MLLANALGFVLVPAMARLSARGVGWPSTLPLVALAAACLGAVFPLVSHFAVAPDARAGARVSYLYLANIAGCASGSLVTGFVLMDHWSMRGISVFLGLLGTALGALVLAASRPSPGRLAAGLGGAGALAALAVLLAPPLFDAAYEKLQFKAEYRPGMRFAHVVETRSGVVTVTADGTVYGGGIYDGAFNTGLEDDRNLVIRAYALAGMHPAPREVLMIGLSSGSWATVVANNPRVERLTVVEINPGCVRLIPHYPMVAGLLDNPKVRIEFDDARRWLARNRDRRFDAVVANTTFHWRANAANLLSVEFLGLVRAHLKEGGVYYFNATRSGRAQKTAASFFPHALRLHNFVAAGDAPIGFEFGRLRERLLEYPLDGRPLFDLGREEDRERLERIRAWFEENLEGRESILARTEGLAPITDDNMGTEWTEYPR